MSGFGGALCFYNSRMSMFERESKVEILPVSGTLRVSIQPRPNLVLMLLDVAAGLLFWSVTIKQWATLSLVMRALFIWADLSTIVALLYQLSGSEEVEFDPQNVTIRKNIIGWERTREYPVENCSELEWRASSEESRGSALQCKVGWRTVRFAEYTSEEQGTQILVALQQALPDVFRKVGAMPGMGKSSFITLGLS